MSTATQTQPTNRTKHVVRCGWCIANNHSDCAATIRMNAKIWRCPCGCETSQKNRCVECRRIVDEVDSTGACADRTDCQGYRAQRAAERDKKSSMAAVRAAARQNAESGSETPRKAARTPSRPRTGTCVCCGEPTKGGKFLPGHDARYVSRQAEEYLKVQAGGLTGSSIYGKMEALGAALHAKWVKRVEALRVKKEEDQK